MSVDIAAKTPKALGLEAHHQGDLTTAISQYRCHLSQQPQDLETLSLLGMALGQARQYEQALHVLEDAHQLDEDDINVHQALGNVCRHLTHYKRAENHYCQVLKKLPNHPGVHNNLGILYYQQQRYEEASGHFRLACQHKPDLIEAFFNLGLCYLHMEKTSWAMREFGYTLKLNPQHTGALAQLGQHYHRQDDLKTAISYYRKHLAIDDQQALIHHQLGCALLAQGQDEEAIAAFSRAVALDEDHGESHHNLANIYLLRHDLDRALVHGQRSTQIDPQAFDSWYNLGVIYSYLQRHQDAVACFDMALKQTDLPQEQTMAALLNLAAQHLKLHQTSEALDTYQRLLMIVPDHEEALFMVNALEQKAVTDYRQAPKSYVQNLFDAYADHYDEHLRKMLDYRLDRHLDELIKLNGQNLKPGPVLDLGCGTGLAAMALKPWATKLIGVDLSPLMLAQARRKAIYDELICEDVLSYALKAEPHQWHLVVLADVLPYWGDITELMAACAQLLTSEGLLILSAESTLETTDYTLSSHARYRHHPDYVEKVAISQGLSVMQRSDEAYRQQQGQPIDSMIWVFKRSDTTTTAQIRS